MYETKPPNQVTNHTIRMMMFGLFYTNVHDENGRVMQSSHFGNLALGDRMLHFSEGFLDSQHISRSSPLLSPHMMSI